MIQQFIDNHKKALAIALILIAVVLIGGITVFALSSPPDNDVAVVGTSSEESSAPTSSVTVSVPEIKKPEPLPISSVPTSSESTSSAASSAPTSSQAKVDVTASVDQKPVASSAPAATSPKPPASSATAVESKPQTLPAMPQPNPDLAKPANRNMPSFTVDSSIMGPQGSHGQFDGSRYYHAGCDTWMDEEYWFVYRYGQHPEANDYLNYAPQVSPYQQDGDYDPFNAGLQPGMGCYYCQPCNGWISAGGWENGKHFDGNPKHK